MARGSNRVNDRRGGRRNYTSPREGKIERRKRKEENKNETDRQKQRERDGREQRDEKKCGRGRSESTTMTKLKKNEHCPSYNVKIERREGNKRTETKMKPRDKKQREMRSGAGVEEMETE